MGRPRTPIGTYGHIAVTKIADKTADRPAVHEAEAYFRMPNGKLRRLRKRGSSATAARNALKHKMLELAGEVSGKAISSATRFAHVAGLWLADLERKVKLGDLAPKTLYDYRDTLRNQLLPRLGELACREVSFTAADETIKAVHDEVGYSSAKRAKVVLSGICGYALRHGAMTANPARSVEAMSAPKAKKIRVLEPEQRADFLAKLRGHAEEKGREGQLGPRARSWTDLPDIAEAMLATGARLGEILAVVGDDVDPTTRRVVMDHHLVRIAGEGIVRVPLRKGAGEGLTLVFPTWATPLFRRRKLESGGAVLFPAWNGALVDPSNVAKRFRRACDAIGYGDVSSHVFRHTTATHLGDAGVESTAIADQLGNTTDVVERHYRRKRIANERIAGALESLMGEGKDEDDEEAG